ncbi:hypothetical protein MHUMG1_07248 [Metarhizium humberi]|uniref:Uncharacterized protein n=1 Tax=Metarhizium humberi TaxID=2596975 RepID=A0A9P8M730_9HYPO|nr:hypothetical protein MHUMG1_07248 [Metarhizium humberi]
MTNSIPDRFRDVFQRVGGGGRYSVPRLVPVILGMSLIALLDALVGWFGAQKLSINKLAAISRQIQQAQVMEKPCGETPADVISFCWLPEARSAATTPSCRSA